MKILLIDDRKQIVENLVAFLKKSLHEVDIVYNVSDGENYAMTGVYDSIILDVGHPLKNTLCVVRSLRIQGNSTPVMLLAPKSVAEDIIAGLDAGSDDYLTRPFAPGELLARLRAITRRGSAFIGDRLRAGNTTLDKNTHALGSEKGAVKLTTKEYHIMEILLSNSRQIIPRERFLEKIWGFDSTAEYNSIEVYISFVRKKLAAIGSNLRIKAARNIGYSLEAP